ncbi:MAG: 50S ribosomal protein L4 [Patescibacteria group bacterium]
MSVATFTKAGTKATVPAKLDKAIFGIVPKNHELLKTAYVAYLANGRTSAAKTKTRGLVSGGGRKPWKQKGTGRARFGSSRNPIWRGGGIAFGPTGLENYSHKLNISAKRQAIRQSLSIAAAENKLIVLEDITLKTVKTSEIVGLLTKIGANKTTLLVVADKTEDIVRVTKNLQNIKLIQATYINVYDVMNADNITITKDALALVTAWLTPKIKAAKAEVK